MPYKDKSQDREKHREYMRRRRQGVTKLDVTPIVPGVTPDVTPIEATENPSPRQYDNRARDLYTGQAIENFIPPMRDLVLSIAKRGRSD